MPGRNRIGRPREAALAALLLAALLIPVPAAPSEGPLTAVLLGDSLTARGDWSALVDSAVILNHGVNGAGLRDLASRLAIALASEPDILVLQVGINDIFRGARPEDVVRGHRELWGAILARRPGIRLVVCSLLTVSPKAGEDVPIINHLVRKTNALLFEAARARGIEWLDLGAALAGPAEALDDSLTAPDGLHLSARAYELWREALRPIIAGAPARPE